MEGKTYSYFRYKSGDQPPERVEKTEDQFDEQENLLFLGTLIDTWYKTPKGVQQRFIRHLADEYIKNDWKTVTSENHLYDAFVQETILGKTGEQDETRF